MANQFLGSPQNTLITIDIKYKSKSSSTVKEITKTKILGAVQQFAYQVRRAKAPIYVIGSADPITIAKGARSVAGSLQGVVLDESFQVNIIKYFWAEYVYNGIYKIQGQSEIEDIYGTKGSFINNIVIPFVSAVTGNAANIDNNAFDENSSVFIASEEIQITEAMKLPPLYLDEVPPLELKLVTPLQFEDGKITYEEITFYGIEFLNNDLAIAAGQEAMFESTNFIQRSVSKVIKTAEA